MSDADKVYSECRACHGVEEVSDACARVIASWWHSGQTSAGYAFVSTGAITYDPDTGTSDLWRELGGSEYDSLDADDKLALDMLGTYFVQRWIAGDAGAQEGWSRLWV